MVDILKVPYFYMLDFWFYVSSQEDYTMVYCTNQRISRYKFNLILRTVSVEQFSKFDYWHCNKMFSKSYVETISKVKKLCSWSTIAYFSVLICQTTIYLTKSNPNLYNFSHRWLYFSLNPTELIALILIKQNNPALQL